MPRFIYKAKRSTGEIYSGEQEAADRYEVYKTIKGIGDEVVSVDERKLLFTLNHLSADSFRIPFLSRVKTHEKITFARNLGAMIQAGLPISRALTVMERQTNHGTLKKILAELNVEISRGQTLSDAMRGYKNVFSSLFISMVRAGEEGGTLAESLRVVALQMDRSYSLQRRIRGAMMYPAIIVLAMVIIAVLMLTYIVPTLMKTFTELKITLPMSTQIVLGTSTFVRDHGFIVLILVIVFFLSIYLVKRLSAGKWFIHGVILHIPIIGLIIKEVNAARTARTLSSLLNSGVDVVDSVQITADVIQNVRYKKVLSAAVEVIKKGAPISEVFTQNSNIYPIFLGEMMSVGEETGKMGEMLLNVATFYEEDVEQKTKDMSTVIEPFLMVIIGAAVGFFAVAMISPMYSLVDAI